MTTAALALVLIAGVLHATWNLFAKKVSGGAPFTWLMSLLASCLYAPLALALIAWQRPEIDGLALTFIIGSGVLHVGYFLLLQRGYQVADLSLVYPLARGTGPFLSTLLAILIFSERPSVLALMGAGLIILSVFLLAGGTALLNKPGQEISRAIGFGLLTGLFIAAYTLWDSYAVAVLLLSPLLYDWANNLVRTALLTPSAIRNWSAVRHHWREHRLACFMVALLSPLAYILVLTALSFSPVSYIAPAREISILFGTLMGTQLLKEGHATRKLMAACLMVLGVMALALG